MLAAGLALVLLGLPVISTAVDYSVLRSVSIHAQVDPATPSVNIRWPLRTDMEDYLLKRIDADGSEAFAITLEGDSLGYDDTTITIGEVYEYRVVGDTIGSSYSAMGTVTAAIDLPAVENRGSVLLVIEESMRDPLAPEIAELKYDLIAEGWLVADESVAATDSAVSVKAKISTWAAAHSLAPDRAVFLLGKVPVAESGDFAPDGHANHRGPWPADSYYGELDGDWGTTTSPFTPSYLPDDVDLMVGRVDLSNMPAFADDEGALLRQYLKRLHAFRHGNSPVVKRARIDNRLTTFSEGFGSTARSGFSAICGPTNVQYGALFPSISNGTYLLGHAVNYAGYTSMNGIASTSTFAQQPSKAVFLTMFGSYFGDWNVTNNLLRAPLCAEGFTLATGYSGRPQWNMHDLGLGRPLGQIARLSQNTKTGNPYYTGYYARGVHVALMGDPTITLFPTAPPLDATASRDPVDASTVTLHWTAAADSTSPDFLGYHVFHAMDSASAFTRLTTNPVTASTSWTDMQAEGSPSEVYLVRALWRVTTGSGSFLNLSQGAFAWPDPTEIWVVKEKENAAELGPDSGRVRFQRSDADTSRDLAITYTLTGSATVDDLESLSGTIVIPAGEESRTLSVTPVPDALVEGMEYASLILQDRSHYTVSPEGDCATVAIEDHPEQAWRLEQFGNDANDLLISGPEADPDGDRRINLVEYAQGTSPMHCGHDQSQSAQREEIAAGQNQFAFRFSVNPAATNIRFVPEICTDGTNWEEFPNPAEHVETGDDSIESWECVCPVTASPIFARLRIVRIP